MHRITSILREEAAADVVSGGTGETPGGASGDASGTILSGSGSSQHDAGGTGVEESPWSWTADEAGTFSEGWQGKLGGDLKDHPSLAPIGSLEDLAKSYVHTKQMVGKRLEAPGEDATPEQLAEWRKVVGAPETADAYGDLRPESVPEELWDSESAKAFSEIAHKHNLPPAAVKEIVGHYANEIQAGLEASEAEAAQFVQGQKQQLQKEWGGEFDRNLNIAAQAARAVGLNPEENQIFTDAEVVKAFANMGRLMSEDKLVQGDSRGVNGSITDRIQEITDPSSQSTLAREYRGELGPERQAAAQQQYHQLLAAKS